MDKPRTDPHPRTYHRRALRGGVALVRVKQPDAVARERHAQHAHHAHHHALHAQVRLWIDDGVRPFGQLGSLVIVGAVPLRKAKAPWIDRPRSKRIRPKPHHTHAPWKRPSRCSPRTPHRALPAASRPGPSAGSAGASTGPRWGARAGGGAGGGSPALYVEWRGLGLVEVEPLVLKRTIYQVRDGCFRSYRPASQTINHGAKPAKIGTQPGCNSIIQIRMGATDNRQRGGRNRNPAAKTAYVYIADARTKAVSATESWRVERRYDTTLPD